MAKQTGLGDNFYIGGYDLSGDVNALTAISLPSETLDATAINKSAMERQLGKAGGEISFTTLFNDATDQEHDALSGLLRTARIAMWFRGTALNNAAACLQGKQINYDPTRDAAGGLVIAVQVLSSEGEPLEHGVQGTAGKRTDSAATNGTGFENDDGATTNGLAMYYQLFAFTGTSVTIALQESSDNAVGDPYAAVTGATSGALASAPAEGRVATAAGLAVEAWLRVVTTGTFSDAVFAVGIVRL